MKFSIKLVLCITALVSIIFSLAGFVMIYQNFRYSFDESFRKNNEKHRIERYAIESNVVNDIMNGKEITDERILEYGEYLIKYIDNDVTSIEIYDNNKSKVFSNFHKDIDISDMFINNVDLGKIIEVDNKKYMAISSTIDINENILYILTISDISGMFDERDRQLKEFFMLDLIIIITSSISIGILSFYLTKPIKNLNNISKEISKGSYDKRIKVKSRDEIGELGKSFNIMAEAIEDRVSELNLSVKQREDFISNFSHELKTPMTAIIGYSDLLRKNKLNNEEKDIAINYIYTEAKRLEMLSRKLLDLMSLSDENIEIERINMLDFKEEIRNIVKPILKTVELELMVEDTDIVADKILLQSLTLNLIENARKAEPKDNKIILKGERLEDKYRISVIDMGSGIGKEELSRITESFYMVDKSRAKQNGGTGLGLSICKKIANLHGTDLVIESETGIGTKVSFEMEVYDYE